MFSLSNLQKFCALKIPAIRYRSRGSTIIIISFVDSSSVQWKPTVASTGQLRVEGTMTEASDETTPSMSPLSLGRANTTARVSHTSVLKLQKHIESGIVLFFLERGCPVKVIVCSGVLDVYVMLTNDIDGECPITIIANNFVSFIRGLYPIEVSQHLTKNRIHLFRSFKTIFFDLFLALRCSF